MAIELPKQYNPADVEDRLYKFWTDKGYFTPVIDKNNPKPPFTIVIPPPNVTGQLHMGHALNNTMQDIIIRTKRMQGYPTLWIPGTDHAGIATQIKVEENLRKTEGKSRHDLGREAFLEKVWDWKRVNGGRIIDQLKKLGSSCDWTRERFTMDEQLSRAVRKVFVILYKKGLIYRGYRIINWCPNCTTALSDTEVDHVDEDGKLWHIKYPIKGGGELVVATTRPETMLGDTAVAVNPNDERYKNIIGKSVLLPLTDREIPIIADEYVETEFGTGCVKITPCHDPNDFEVAQRHSLEMIEVLDANAKINSNGGKYAGMDRYDARKAVLVDLDALGYLVKTENHAHAVGHCYRCSTTVEPMSSRQWFVAMKALAEPAIKVVEDGDLEFIPDRFAKIYLNWMRGIQDWCISRQLWWGHRIPAYYCDDCGEIAVEEYDVTECPKCGSQNIKQDEDVLDTWFSSALWPFSTLGWPDETEDLKYFYPTSTLVTAYDIITFWVSKMIFQSLEVTGKKPFDKVFIHGLVRDSQGRKMSKSLGNGIDPLEVIDEYGADALRFMLATGNSPGNDMRFSTEKVESSRNFANKVWNSARFVLMNLEEGKNYELDKTSLRLEDKWVISLYNTLISEVTANIEKYELGIAVSKLYDFIWDIFCDWYIEIVKPRLFAEGGDDSAKAVLVYVLSGTLKLLHPFMPFITEEIWQKLPHEGESIMVSEYPVADVDMRFEAEEKRMDSVIGAIRAIRNIRAEMNVPPSRKAKLYITPISEGVFSDDINHFFEKLAHASSVEYGECPDSNAAKLVTDSATVMIPVSDMVDMEAERNRLRKELESCEKELQRVDAKLSNEEFVSRAPAKIVEAEKEKREKYLALQKNLTEALEKLQ